MVNQQPGAFALSTDDMAALKRAGVTEKIIAAMIVRNGASTTQPLTPSTPIATTSSTVYPSPLILHDATPIRLRLNRNLSSADAKTGDNIDFEVLDDLKVDDVLLIARGGTAIATVDPSRTQKA
jgi:hypothetical protein